MLDCVETSLSSLTMSLPLESCFCNPTEFVLSMARVATTFALFVKGMSTRMVWHSTSHLLSQTDETSKSCFCQHHNTTFFRLEKIDSNVAGTKRKDCCCRTQETVADHATTTKRAREQQSTCHKPSMSLTTQTLSTMTKTSRQSTELQPQFMSVQRE